MVCSCCFLYALRRSKIISFTVGDSFSDNAASMVPMKTLRQTSPLAGTYLLYMVNFNYLMRICRCFISSYIIDVYELQYFFLKASYYGVCSWSKCSHVHYPQANHSCFHNGCRISSGRTKVYVFSCWKVRSAAATCNHVLFLQLHHPPFFCKFIYSRLISQWRLSNICRGAVVCSPLILVPVLLPALFCLRILGSWNREIGDFIRMFMPSLSISC